MIDQNKDRSYVMTVVTVDGEFVGTYTPEGKNLDATSKGLIDMLVEIHDVEAHELKIRDVFGPFENTPRRLI